MAVSHPVLAAQLENFEADSIAALAHAVPATERRVRSFGGAVALVTLDRPNTLFNRVVGLRKVEHVAEIVEYYASLGVPPRIDVPPVLCSPELRSALESAGLQPGGFPFFSRRLLLASHNAWDASRSNVEVERASEADVEAFVAVTESAWPVGASTHRRALAEARAQHARGQRRYCVRLDGQIVAVATMDIHHQAAYLNLAATLEHARGRGFQSALIRHRLADAAAAGAVRAFTIVAPDSTSERNLRRAGFDHGYDREVWLPPDWMQHPFYRNAA